MLLDAKNKVLGLALLSLLAACAKPPKMEMADAENALNAAEQAGAAEYADVEFAAAREAFADAQAKIEAKNYKAAREAAILSRTKAEEAAAAVTAGKEAAKEQSGQLIVSVEEKLKTIKESAAKVKGAAAKDINDALKSFDDAWTTVKEDNLKENFANVARRSEEFTTRVDELGATVAEKAKAALAAVKKKR
ncbi:MAG: DUF4398 domain-containing protein [Elusimicrobia bacterium]|nr:DUF4398 domain-containing protein [Elusimicrobiota bacterium]MBK9694990.1 DUF4398 domain-containing protein [Elusimicrobiota bacterium]MBP8005209.1 DUF4398 domain-containing protein [Elusimicrobiota bacterium]